MRKRIWIFHRRLKRKGIYTLAWKSTLRLLVVVVIIGIAVYFAQAHINNFKEDVNFFLQKWNAPFVLSLFYISESLLGLIPPDFFIVWSSSTSHPLIFLTVLALLSYLGGITAYYIGRKISLFPRVHNWLKVKFSSHFATLHKYGGFLIVFAALFPLPFSTVTLVSGMIDYPFRKVYILGLARFLRFFLYALVLFHVF